MTRTGIKTKHRRCPRHESPLEVAVVDDYYPPTYLNWWCEECGGYWSELYFTMRVEATLPVMALVRKFQIRCPRCGSLHTSRACSFECCDYHYCNDCDEYFDINYKVATKSSLSDEKLAKLKAIQWLDDNNVVSTINEDRFEHYEASVTSPCCETHPDSPVTLVVDPIAVDERFRFGWFCKGCDTVMFDYTHPYQRRGRSFFAITDHPDFRCRVCHHCEFDQSEDLLDATCVTCGTTFRISASPAPKT